MIGGAVGVGGGAYKVLKGETTGGKLRGWLGVGLGDVIFVVEANAAADGAC
jgi:hypothetical protein